MNEVAIELAISEIIDKITRMPKVVEVLAMRFGYSVPDAVVITLHSDSLGMAVREEVRSPCPEGVNSEDWARLISLRLTNIMNCGGRFTVGAAWGDRDEGFSCSLLTLIK